MEFTPKENTTNPLDVPFFHEATAEGGWAGQGTGQTIRTLRSQITQAMTRLGATITVFQEGTFGDGGEKPRDGFMVHYTYNGVQGSIKIAALPVKKPDRINAKTRAGYATRKKKAMKMALYMFRDYLRGAWYAQQLSPGYLPLIPWMLSPDTGLTVSETFQNGPLALPEPDGNFTQFLDAEWKENE